MAGDRPPRKGGFFRVMALSGEIPNRYEIDEKNAIIALQAILTARGVIPEEKYERFAYYLGRLPPQRAILVYGQAINAIANRLEEENPYRDALKKLSQTITESIHPEAEPDHRQLAESFNQISTLMAHVREDKIAS